MVKALHPEPPPRGRGQMINQTLGISLVSYRDRLIELYQRRDGKTGWRVKFPDGSKHSHHLGYVHKYRALIAAKRFINRELVKLKEHNG